MTPKVVAVDYLAFYQPGAFGPDHRWQVRSFAPVLGHELTTRGALLNQEIDHPRVREEYFKIQLGPLATLPAPIHAAGWRRFTFLYTTGAYLQRARVLRDLVIRTAERKLLWRALRERALLAQDYRFCSLPPEEALADEVLADLLGVITQSDPSKPC